MKLTTKPPSKPIVFQGFRATMQSQRKRARRTGPSSKARKRGRSTSSRRRPVRANTRPGGVIGIERHWHDTEYSAAIVEVRQKPLPLSQPGGTTSWANANASPVTEGALTTPSRGSDVNQYLGNKLDMTSLHIRGQIAIQGGNALSVTRHPVYLVRVIVFMDKNTNGTQSDGNLVVDDGIFGYRNLGETQRYRILKDKIFRVKTDQHYTAEAAAPVGVEGTVTKFSWNFNFKKPIMIQMDGDGGDVTTVRNNSVQILAAMCRPVIAVDGSEHQTPVLNYQARMRFVG